MSRNETTQPKGISSEERLTILLNDSSLSSPIHKIKKIQPYLRDRSNFSKHYNPMLLSIGPIHHKNENLKLGEHYKQKWTRAYFPHPGSEDTKKAAQYLRQKISSKLQYLKKQYSEDAIKEYNDDDLVWMFLVDGCSVLHIINHARHNWGMEAAMKLEIKIDQLFVVLQDMLLLENQLPYELLSILSDGCDLEESILQWIQNHNMLEKTGTPPRLNGPPPAHLLDLLHKALLQPSDSSPSVPGQQPSINNQPMSSQSGGLSHSYRTRNIQELKAAGIKVKKSKTKNLSSLRFTSSWWFSGLLELPEIIVDDFTAPTLMNLIAYEMCPDFLNNFEISSYVSFLDLLIDHPDDVKELRSAGVLQSHLTNDQEVANLFNTINTYLIVDKSKYAIAKNNIEKHCNNRWKTWMAQVYYVRFNSPWAIIAFLTMLIVTRLIMLQTWLIFKHYTKKHF